jgi:hypothetical protein
VRHRFYALVGLLNLRQFPVHWERNENKHAISKGPASAGLRASTVHVTALHRYQDCER